MDLPLINETSFTSANPSSYTLAGIWALNSITEGFETGAVLGRRMPHLERDASIDESTVTEQSLGHGGRRKRKNYASDDVSSQLIPSDKRNNGISKREEPENAVPEPKIEAEFADKVAEPSKDYIHVRARRGQATDSHSLAERARREKISERMKTLQDLVPGCYKVIGKAMVLDEIINYIQSLQRQVEFLSMKLEAVNDVVCVEGARHNETVDVTGMMSSREYAPWLHMI